MEHSLHNLTLNAAPSTTSSAKPKDEPSLPREILLMIVTQALRSARDDLNNNLLGDDPDARIAVPIYQTAITTLASVDHSFQQAAIDFLRSEQEFLGPQRSRKLDEYRDHLDTLGGDSKIKTQKLKALWISVESFWFACSQRSEIEKAILREDNLISRKRAKAAKKELVVLKKEMQDVHDENDALKAKVRALECARGRTMPNVGCSECEEEVHANKALNALITS